MNKTRLKPLMYGAVSAAAVALSLLNLYLAKTWDAFGSPALFAIAILFQLILLVTLAYSLLIVFWRPIQIVGSILVSAAEGALSNPYVRKVMASKSPLVRWVRGRFNLEKPTGAVLTVSVLVAGFFLAGFAAIAKDVVSKNALTAVDLRVLNLVPTIRSDVQTRFFSFVTFWANWPSVLLLVGLSMVLLWRYQHKLAASLFALALLIEEGTFNGIKHLVDRPRPDFILSIVRETSSSFPSGHVLRATVLFGLLAYYLIKCFRSSLSRLFIIVGYVTAVFLVALSRIYLGVHFPSDVLASMLLGSFLLAIFIATMEIATRYKLWGQNQIRRSSKKLIFIPLIIFVLSLFLSPVLVRITPIMVMPGFTFIDTIDASTIPKLPLYSETLTGATMEPIGFIYVGYEDQITKRFEAAGWFRADPATFANTLKALAVGFQGGQYLSAPMTPSYLAAKPHDLGFEKPTATNTLRQRHHTRIWRTGYSLPDGQPIWVATASFDEGIAFVGPAKLPTHHINPNIDAERSFIIDSLGFQSAPFLRAVDPQLGQNASGDAFFTDGRAVLIRL